MLLSPLNLKYLRKSKFIGKTSIKEAKNNKQSRSRTREWILIVKKERITEGIRKRERKWERKKEKRKKERKKERKNERKKYRKI